eukprot:g17428.t1
MPAETLCAVLAACFMIGWNVMVTEERPTRDSGSLWRPRRRHERRHRLSRRRGRRSHRRPSPSTDRSAQYQNPNSTSINTPSEEGGAVGDKSEGQEEEEDCLAAVAGPCEKPPTAPASLGHRSPVSPTAAAAAAAAATSSPGSLPLPSSSPPPPQAMFQDLVLILDAPALPPPPWKLPNLPEEMDVDTSSTADIMTMSPSRGGCDLSPGFHLSAPWSPPARRGSWGAGNGLPRHLHHYRASPLGNRPRTFSEYSAAPPSADSPVPPLLQERSVSASTGLSEAAAADAAAAWRRPGGEAEEVGGVRLGGRTRSFTCGSRDVESFADWSGGGGDEGSVMGEAACVSPPGDKVGGVENGGVGRPVSPFHRRRRRSRPYFGR